MFGRLARRGHDVTLLVSRWPGAVARTTLDGMTVHRVGSRHTYNVIAPRYYRTVLRPNRYDVFVEDLNKVPLFVPLWSRDRLALLVHHLFGSTAFTEASFPVAAATWLLERPLSRVYRKTPVLAVSRSTAEDLVARGFRPEQIRVSENGVDTGHYSPDFATGRFTRPTVLYLCRLKKYKRVDLVLQSFAAILRTRPTAQLVVAGTGDAAPELKALAASLGIEANVEFAGFVPEAEKLRLLRGAWVHVLTSPKEGWGISVVEAAACGTATVASNSPGLRDSVVDRETGFLVPHGDVTALADRIGEVLDNAQLRERLGQAARQFAERHTWERAADEMEAFLTDVARAKPK